VRRRDFIALGGAALLVAPTRVRGQSAKTPRIGVLNPNAPHTDAPGAAAFYDALAQLGYIEGRTILIERRYAAFDAGRFQVLATELADLKVDVLVVISTAPAQAAKQATSTIPIIVGGMADPVADGLVNSLARPSGNITGTTFLGPELIGKRFGLLKQAIPSLTRVAALEHPAAYGERTMEAIIRDARSAAAALGLQLQIVQAHGPADIDQGFFAAVTNHAEGIVVLPSAMLYAQYKEIVKSAAKHRLPAIYAAREFADAGGLMSYGANLPDLFARTATYVDKILKGAKTQDLPIEQPTKFEFIVNLKAVKQLELSLSREFLLLADEVIE
jgi:putative ABC transport system substrate-binding protein